MRQAWLIVCCGLALCSYGCDDEKKTPPPDEVDSGDIQGDIQVDAELDEELAPDEHDAEADDTQHDDAASCPLEVPLSVSIEGLPELLPQNTRELSVTLRFSRELSAFPPESVQLDGGAQLNLTGAGAEYHLAISGLQLNGAYALRILGAAQGPLDQCGDGLPDALEQAFYVDGWSLREPWQSAALAERSAPLFANINEEAGLNGKTSGDSRAQIADVDGDGQEDLVVWPTSRTPMHPKIFRRLGRGTQISFMEVATLLGIGAADAAIFVFGDVDNDGDLDAFTGTAYQNPGTELGIWLNDGRGVFSRVEDPGFAGAFDRRSAGHDYYKTMSAASFADFDGDGWLDLYIGTWYSGSASSGGQLYPPDDELYRGDGTGHFTLVELPSQHNPLSDTHNPELVDISRAAYGIAVADYDDDGDLDIFVNNYGAGRPAFNPPSPPLYIDHNFLWRNDGDMSFTDVGIEAGVAATMRGIGGVQEESPVVIAGVTYPSPIGGNGFGCQWSDFDNDGDLDLIVGTIAHPDYPQSDRTMLHVNQGDGRFSEESAERGLEYYEDELHPVWVDVDNDGRLDLVVSRLRGGSKWEFYFQDEQGHFVKQSYAFTGVDIQRPGPSVWFDVDEDGDLDFYLARDGEGILYRNLLGQENNWLVFELHASAPRDATGAMLSLETSTGTQRRDISSGNGHFNTQSSRRLHFGLGGDNGAKNVSIRWPNGEIQELGALKANRRLRVTQGGSIEMF
ncbi:MAG: CRTAC1 family protein [Myxococcota bacterium]|jgi:hypothetical protein|nr:CRTAC1 family protein [Myxococcota bacterium]